MLKRFALLAALAAVLVTFAGSAGAITGNYSKDFKNDFVGLLVFYTAPDANGDIFSHRCSGSLLSDRVTIVTAGHCTEGVDTGRVYFQQAAAPNYSPTAFGGLGGDETTGYPYTGGNAPNQPYSRTFSVADNYGFHDFEGYPNNLDAGVVVLDTPYTTPSGTYGELPTAGAVHRYIAANKSKKDIRFVERLRPLGSGPRAGLVQGTADRDDLPRELGGAGHRVQPEDDRERFAGQGRHVQRRFRRPDLLRGHPHDRGRHLVRHERPVQGPRFLVPARPAGGPRLDQRPEPPGRR